MASGTEKELHIRESEPASREADIPRVKPSPKSGLGKIPVPFEYIPSDDGTDENLLVLLHGLGAVQIRRSMFALNCVEYRRHACSLCETRKAAQAAADGCACTPCA